MSDKRAVSTDALETLGNIIGEGAGRDAIHLAVEPVIAAETLSPGQDVGFIEGGVGACRNPVGIVDPFLKGRVATGDRFWLIIYPRQITSLRHVWSHPAFPEEGVIVNSSTDEKVASEAWLREFCATHNCPCYETVMEVIQQGNTMVATEYGDMYGGRMEDESIHFNGIDAHSSIPDEFWNHVEVVTNKKFADRPTYFSCSC